MNSTSPKFISVTYLCVLTVLTGCSDPTLLDVLTGGADHMGLFAFLFFLVITFWKTDKNSRKKIKTLEEILKNLQNHKKQ